LYRQSSGPDGGSQKEGNDMTTTFTRPAWLDTAAFYEIYPQSFCDTNGDGIGDIPGITGKLDYIASLGCNALWINPCYDSPFKDAGYDVRDYRKVAPRYGTNDDLVELFRQAHARGIHVLLDLVPGHTSEEHPWFKESQSAERNEYSDRYIWTDSAFEGYSMPFIGGESERNATYILNFFKCQPALNYGFAKRDRRWQSSTDSAAAKATRDAMVDVMRFWLGLGCDGFRVDMANSLVKNDGEDKPETIKAWQEMLGTIKSEFPQAAFVSEWGVPEQALEAGFDMDFYLDWRFGGNPNGYNLLARNTDNALDTADDHSYFSAKGGGSVQEFLSQYIPQYQAIRGKGYFCFITCNHDTPRLAPRLTKREQQVAFGMFLTMPGVPFIYYGDEIGMRYRDLPTKEGGYARTGSRTPMQWDRSKNMGFSSADSDSLYLPVDPAEDAPNVAEQERETDSMLAWVRALLSLRADHRALRAKAPLVVLAQPEQGRSFAYSRVAEDGSERLVVAMNPGLNTETITVPAQGDKANDPTVLLCLGNAQARGSEVTLGPQSFVIVHV
jgi:glycosidase